MISTCFRLIMHKEMSEGLKSMNVIARNICSFEAAKPYTDNIG